MRHYRVELRWTDREGRDRHTQEDVQAVSMMEALQHARESAGITRHTEGYGARIERVHPERNND